MNIPSVIEAILFVASKPLLVSVIAKTLKRPKEDVVSAIHDLQEIYNREDSGIHLLINGDEVEMATHPEYTSLVEQFVKEEVKGELTSAQLETLTVLAYRGPMTRAEVEQIRGVNCAVILRNLLVRGLIEEREDAQELLPMYQLSFEALAGLGIKSVAELSEYESLRAHPHLEEAAEKKEPV